MPADNLVFLGIAVIWIFKKDVENKPTIPHSLLWPGLLLVCALAADLLHYFVAALIWRQYYREKEKAGIGKDVELQHEVWRERVIYSFYLLKVSLVIVAYVLIVSFFIRNIWET
jgi:hypothetical protein